MSASDETEMSTVEISPIWNILESHGVHLPDYITRLLELTGYANLQSISKLKDHELIEELEQYATDNLDVSDLGLSLHEEKFYFHRVTKKFSILPGHKHLIYDAAETVQKVLQRAEQEMAMDRQSDDNNQNHNNLIDGDRSGLRGALHFLSEFASTLNNVKKNRAPRKPRDPNKPPPVIPLSTVTVEEEQRSLTEYLSSYIARKALTGQLEPFVLDVDYRINVFRPKCTGTQPQRPDIYSFVCLRCNTTIKVFKRSNGTNWNAANVCRHLAIVHCHPSLGPKVFKKRSSKDKSLNSPGFSLSSAYDLSIESENKGHKHSKERFEDSENEESQESHKREPLEKPWSLGASSFSPSSVYNETPGEIVQNMVEQNSHHSDHIA